MSNRYAIEGPTMTGIADAVRKLIGENTALTPAQIESKIRSVRTGVPVDVSVSGDWVRPSNYPDLDSITIDEDFDGLYLTYDLSKTDGVCAPWIGVRTGLGVTSATWLVERGHLESGVFVADASYPQIQSAYFKQYLDTADGMVQLWRVSTAGGHFSSVKFETDPNGSCTYDYQPCVEKVGRLNWISDFDKWGGFWLERERTLTKGYGTVTSLRQVWENCYSLQSLDLSGWDTSGWAVTAIERTWYNCYSLRSLDLSGWDTSGWRVTVFTSVWSACLSLQSLDLSGWDTSGWAVTSFDNTWNDCYSLQSLDLSGWNTANWAIRNLNNMWYHCCSLQSLDLSGWDTSGWAVTSFANTWNGCYSLQSLDLSGWNTANWHITSMGSVWNECYSLQSLDLSGWNTSGWVIRDLSTLWSNCKSLQSLDLSGWDTSGWLVTSIRGTWNDCYSLQSLDLSGWDTSGWVVTNMNATWNGCRSLQSLDLRGWNTSGWNVTNTSMMLTNCYALREVYFPVDFLANSNYTSGFELGRELLLHTNGAPIKQSHSFNNSKLIDHDSLVSHIGRLPTVASTKTLTLGNFNKAKLTEAEIAVATEKGWTVA